MTPQRRGLVIGGGIGGLGAAIALSQREWSIDVIEAAGDTATVGVGLNHPANALRALDSLGLLEQVKELGWEYRGIRRYDEHDELIALFKPKNPDDVPFQISMLRSDLHRILTESAIQHGAEISYGTTWTSLAQTTEDSTVSVTRSDGRTKSYDGVEADPIPVGYGCWRVATPRPDGLIFSETYNRPDAKVTTMILNEETMYLFLVDPSPPDYSNERDRWAEVLDEKLAEFGGIVPSLRDAIRTSQHVHWGQFAEVIPRDRWYDGRIVLIGDAAHMCTPHLAQGAGMALEDAVVLADELDREHDVARALGQFTARRLPRVRFVQEQAHAILTNEMESDPEQKVAFAASLGERQQEITRVLSESP